MPESPLIGSDGVVNLAIQSNGREPDSAVQVLSVHVRHALGQVASARIELMDGDAPTQEWPVAEAATSGLHHELVQYGAKDREFL